MKSAWSQKGNNNAYAQDNEISWIDWNLDGTAHGFAGLHGEAGGFAAGASQPASAQVLSQDREIGPGTVERAVNGHHEPDIVWVRPDGQRMNPEDWHAGWVRCIGVCLNGRTLDDVNAVGEPIQDESFLLLFNPHDGPIDFFMPKLHDDAAWQVCLDTSKLRSGRGAGIEGCATLWIAAALGRRTAGVEGLNRLLRI